MYLSELAYLQLEISFVCTLSNFLKITQVLSMDYDLHSIRLTEEKLVIIQEGEGAITKVDSFLCSCGNDQVPTTTCA